MADWWENETFEDVSLSYNNSETASSNANCASSINASAEPDTPISDIVPNNQKYSINAGDTLPLANEPLLTFVCSKVKEVVHQTADRFNLTASIVSEKLDIDILIFGRSGVGKSELLRAITKRDDIKASPDLDHATQHLTAATLQVDKLTYRFWDSRGIDKWSDREDADNLINELKDKNVHPMCIIYCCAAIGRVESGMVVKLLENLRDRNIPIAYVITNMYAASDAQRAAQIKGGLAIMNEVFINPHRKIDHMQYEFDAHIEDADKVVVRDGHGILIGVNSCLYSNEMLGIRKPEYNVDKLMKFIAIHLNDEQLTKFIVLTLNNRGFWEKASDFLSSRAEKVNENAKKLGFDLRRWFAAIRRLWTRQSKQPIHVNT